VRCFLLQRDVVLSDYSEEEHASLKSTSSGVMASVMELSAESDANSPISSPTVDSQKRVNEKPPVVVAPPPPEPEEEAISERAAWFLAASETLDDSKPMPKTNWDDDDDDPSDSTPHPKSSSQKTKDESRQLVKDRMVCLLLCLIHTVTIAKHDAGETNAHTK